MNKTRAITQTGAATTPIPDSLVSAIQTAVEDLLRPLDAKIEHIQATLESRRKDHYTVEEVADLTGRSADTVRRWISEERIKAIRISGTGPKGRLLIAREEVDAIIGSGLGAQIPDAVAGQ